MAVETQRESQIRFRESAQALRVLAPGALRHPDASGVLDKPAIRFVLVAGTVVFYAFLSLLLAPSMGQNAGVLAVLPVLVGGITFGMLGGGLVGLAALPANAILLNLAGEADGVVVTMSDLPGAFMLVVAGTLIGKLRDLAGTVSTQLADRNAAHEAVGLLSRQNYLLLNAISEGVIGVDLEGLITFANPAAARLLGHSGPELSSKRFGECFPAVTVDGSAQEPGDCVRQTLEEGAGVHDMLLLLSRPDGSSFPVELSVMPVFDKEDVVTGAVVSFSDVSERVESDRARQRSDAEHKTIVENLGEGISITVGAKRVFANEAFARIFGVPHAVALDASLGTGAVDADFFSERIRDFDANPRRVGFIHRIRRPGGDERSIKTVLVPFEHGGQPARLGLISDITEQAEAQGAAKASDARCRGMFDAAIEGVAVLDAQGQILESNPALRAMLEAGGEGPAGTMLLDYLHQEDAQQCARMLRSLFEDGTSIRTELQFVGSDGSPLWAHMTGSLVPGTGEGTGVAFIMLSDVTAQKQALDALTESEAKWRSLVEEAPDLVMTAKRDGTLLFTNHGVNGLDRADIVGTSAFDFVPPEYQSVIAGALDRVFVVAAPDSYEVRGPRQDGTEGWFSVRVSPVLRHGEVVAATISSVDVTGLKRAEEQANRRSNEVSSLLSISNALVQPGPIESRVDEALSHVMDVTAADLAILRVPRGDSFTIVGSRTTHGDGAEMLQQIRQDGQFSRRVMGSRVAIIINDLAEHPDASPRMLGWGFRSLAAIPVLIDDQLLGVLTVGSMKPGFFSPEEERLLAGVADVLGVHLDNTRLMDSQELWARQQEAQFNIARILAKRETFEEKTIEVLGVLAGVTQAEWVGLGLPDHAAGGLRYVATTGIDRVPKALVPVVPFTDPVCGQAWSQGQTVVVQDGAVPNECCQKLAGEEVRSFATVPIKGGGQILGVLSVGAYAAQHFTDEQVAFLTAVGEGMGTLVEHARLHEELGNQLEEGQRRLEAFQDAAMRLTLERDADQGLKQLLSVASAVMDARYGLIAVWDHGNEEPRLMSSGRLPNGVNRGDLAALLGVAATRNRVVRANAADGGRAIGVSEHIGGFVAMPFECTSAAGGVMGVFVPKREGGFTEADERHLSLFSLLAGIVIDNAALYNAEALERGTLTAIQSSMAEGLVVVDRLGHVKYFNDAAETLTGLPADRMAGRPLVDLLRRFETSFSESSELRAVVEMLERPDQLPAKADVTLVAPQHRDLSVSVFPIGPSKSESMIGILLRDVTEERELERRRDTFVSVASHELRTPMTTILGFSELLLSRDPAPEVRRSWLSTIHQDSQYVTAIVDDMLNVARIQSGRMHLELESIDVLELAREVVEIEHDRSEHHRIDLLPSETIPIAVADRFKLQQVFTNLIENAIKYSPEGGSVAIEAHHEPALERVVVSVTDSGIGIAPEDVEHLFSTFHRIRRPETETIRGTGLGLYIVKALVELMGGEVWLRSRVNRGTSFYFSLPTRMPEAQAEIA